MRAQFPKLENLQVGGPDVSDAGIAFLKDVKSLRFLDVSGTKVTAAGAKVLRDANPNLKIQGLPAPIAK